MEKITKTMGFSLKSADAAADMELINKHTLEELQPEQVFCFSVILCDNQRDRDDECFSDACLEAFAPLFRGVTGIYDHRWSAEKQFSRLYHVEVEDGGKTNNLGKPLKNLVGRAYMLVNDATKHTIEAIKGGILKEVSIGFGAETPLCTICKTPMGWRKCANDHAKGKEYDGVLCLGEFRKPADAYEFSLVAIPSQYGAGVTKCCGKCESDKRKHDCENKQRDPMAEAYIAFSTADAVDCDGYAEKGNALIAQVNQLLLSAEECDARAKIIAENRAYLEKYAK